MSRRFLPALAVLSLLLAAQPGAATEDDAPASHPRAGVSARGRLAWIFSDDLDLAGGLAIDVPWVLDDARSLFLDVDTTAAIRRASSLAFDVRDLEYSVTVGFRGRVRRGWLLSGFVEQWGKEMTDADGAPFLRDAGFGIESPGYRARPWKQGLEGRAAAAVVLDDRGLDADFAFHSDARWSFPGERLGMGLDARIDAIAGGDGGSADLEAGPRIDVLRTPASCASFFLHYLHARTPLGLQTSGIVLGFEDAGGASGAAASPPEVRGNLAAGGGDDRGTGRLALQFLSPTFLEDQAWVIGSFDLNVLTSSDISDLFYIYDVGLETARGGATEGIYFRHRSNHRLAEAGEPVTSINVIEAGIETPAWSHPRAVRRGGKWGTWDAAARVGVLIDTSFGDPGNLHALAGARYILPRKAEARLLPYARVEVEDGEIGRRSYAVGFFAPSDLDLKLEYLRDSQLYAKDKTALLLTLGIWF